MGSIETFFESPAFGVAGASNDRSKFGNRVLRAYLSHGRKAYPVNPNESKVEGISCVASVGELPPEVESLSIITPPHITEQVVKAALDKGIRNIWMQPGAESAAAIQACLDAKVNLIADGRCVLVELPRYSAI